MASGFQPSAFLFLCRGTFISSGWWDRRLAGLKRRDDHCFPTSDKIIRIYSPVQPSNSKYFRWRTSQPVSKVKVIVSLPNNKPSERPLAIEVPNERN